MTNRQSAKFKVLIDKLLCENPYYSNFFSSFDIHTLEAEEIYKMLPYLTRNDLQRIGKNIYTPTAENIILEMTSGTTGVPLECPKSRRERATLALDLWAKRRLIDPDVNTNNFYLLYGSKARQHNNYFNYEINNLKKCFSFLAALQPRWLCGSVSAFMIYAKEIFAGNIENGLHKLKFIELQGEFVEEEDRNFIEQVFNAKTIVHYGCREIWTIAYECKYRHLHISDQVIVDIKKRLQSDDFGEIVVTSLNQSILPIIKYNLQDYGIIDNNICKCGKEQTLQLINGRVSTIIKGTSLNGNIVMKSILNNAIMKDQSVIKSFNVSQKAFNEFVVNIVRGTKYSWKTEKLIKEGFASKLGQDTIVIFNYLSSQESLSHKLPIFRVDF